MTVTPSSALPASDRMTAGRGKENVKSRSEETVTKQYGIYIVRGS